MGDCHRTVMKTLQAPAGRCSRQLVPAFGRLDAAAPGRETSPRKRAAREGDMFFDMRAGFFAVFLLPALIFGGAGITRAAAEARPVMSEGEYAEALAFIEGTKSVMGEAEAALGTETSRAEAETRKADLGQRLAVLRRLMTAAAQR